MIQSWVRCIRFFGLREPWSIKKEQSLKDTEDKTRIKILFGITSFSTFQQFTFYLQYVTYSVLRENLKL